jgi:hypothetical protein
MIELHNLRNAFKEHREIITEKDAEIERRKRSSLKPCPGAGQGVNRWLLGETLRQYRARAAEIVKETREVLREGMRGCGRAEKNGEVERALRRAWPDAFSHFPEDPEDIITELTGVGVLANTPSWPPKNHERILALHKQYDGLECGDLEAKSSAKNPRTLSGRDVLVPFFQPVEFVCLGSERWSFGTWQRDEVLRRAAGCRYIVPNPFKAALGTTQDGKPTAKSNSQVLQRRFVIVEFDLEWLADWSFQEKIRLQVRLHGHLAQKYPLALVVFSGNESLHGWYVAEPQEHLNHELMREAVELGADHALWCPSQFTRTPGATHQNGNRQDVLFFAPERLGTL